jgi:hypothetical protein
MNTKASDIHTNGMPKRYKYSLYPKIAGYVLAPLIATFFLGVGTFLLKKDSVGAGLLCLLFAVMFILLIMLTSLTYAPIIISEEGISAYKLSWRMKSIRWQDVKKIQKMRFWNMGAKGC